MMTEADFLRAILDQPEDEMSRLAYADWLLEQPDSIRQARGEFIQVQIQLAQRLEGGGDPSQWIDAGRLPELKAREQQLLEQYGSIWAGPVQSLVDSYQFHKGFIELIALDANRFVRHAAQLFAQTPVRRMRLIGWPNAKFANSEYLTRLTGLDFSRNQMSDQGLRTLLCSPYLENITWLDLSYCYLTDQGILALAQHALLGRLTHLNLGYNLLGQRSVQALFDSPYWGKVRHLVLTGNYYIDSRVQQFLAQRLQGASDPALLRSMLQTASREEREYTNANVRSLAQRAGRHPQQAVHVLTEGLHDGNRKVRCASARMIAQLGKSGTQAVPLLVQRLFEQNALVRDHVAPALARLLPELPSEMQRWLCLLANPLMSAPTNLRDTLGHPRMPSQVREQFAAICARRALWWQHLARGGAGPAPVPEPGSYASTVSGVRKRVTELLDQAGRHAARHAKGKQADRATCNGAAREAAWLLARLTELLLNHCSRAESKVSAAKADTV